MKKVIFKNFISWFSALVCAFIAINVICFAYSRDTGGIFREGGALSFAYQPGTVIINNSEGNGWARVDKNGYLNESAELSDDGYILVLGNSMTNAVQVSPSEKYVSVLNSRLQEKYGDKKVRAYLMARGGADFIELAQGYSAAVEEFPEAKAVVIQIIGGGVSYGSLENVKNQRTYDETQKTVSILESESYLNTFKHVVKNDVPILAFMAHERLYNFQNPFKGAFIYRVSSPENIENMFSRDVQAEEEMLTEALYYLNGIDDRQLIILNLPNEYINKDGGLEISNSDPDIWERACEASGVIFVDMTEEWKELYSTQKKLAFGFSNTSLANGHMNKFGHEATGNRLYKELLEIEVLDE